jgi:hypothetical protein
MEQAEAATRAATGRRPEPEPVVAAADEAEAPLPPDIPPEPDSHEPGVEGRNGDPLVVEHYDDLDPDAIVQLLDSLEIADLWALRDYERGSHARPRVVTAIESVLARRAAGRRGQSPRLR